MSLQKYDQTIFEAIENERKRQHQTLELISSAKSIRSYGHKYAVGYPGKRYYGGCEFVDVVEQAAIERLTKLFGAKYANVQLHSGAQANFAFFSHCFSLVIK